LHLGVDDPRIVGVVVKTEDRGGHDGGDTVQRRPSRAKHGGGDQRDNGNDALVRPVGKINGHHDHQEQGRPRAVAAAVERSALIDCIDVTVVRSNIGRRQPKLGRTWGSRRRYRSDGVRGRGPAAVDELYPIE
jgi:hypothetical protein